ncbi:cell wall protein [Colletotrichum incanum]|uniref:Cell wall protein n=1 Tax=Colletotrichum incanum TaxID=1573173 RepID=A0A166RWM3_COLIC|nr:cell wall protein [Colletotrichum incanum]OHW99028.1 cell wall protein [Colletotrichum incanum]
MQTISLVFFLLTFNSATADKNPQAATPIITASTGVENAIQKAQIDISSSQPLSMADATSLQQDIDGLVMAFRSLVSDMTDKKPIFDQLGASPGAIQFFKQLKSTSITLGQILVSKIPGNAQRSVGQILAAINGGIQRYNAGSGI